MKKIIDVPDDCESIIFAKNVNRDSISGDIIKYHTINENNTWNFPDYIEPIINNQWTWTKTTICKKAKKKIRFI